MATARSATRGLSTEELEAIRDTLAAGRKPKVMFTQDAGQIAGQVGQVVELTDPDLAEEWVVVRFGRDELPFSPADLMIPPKGTVAAKSAASRKTEPVTPAPELKIVREKPAPSPRQEITVPNKSTVDAPPAPVAAPGPDQPIADAKPPRKATKGAKPKAPASFTVTVAYAEGEWTVAAQQGAKVLAKPYLIKASEAVKMVGLLDVPGVQEAVEQIVAAERADAERQAERLRAELAGIEAKLAELGLTR